jgi:hypothetical protein
MRFVHLSIPAVLLLCLSMHAADAPKYDMAKYKGIADEAIKLVKAKDYAGAQKKTTELETAWDTDTVALKAAERKLWNAADKQMDVAMEASKAAKDDATATTALKELDDFKAKLADIEKVK